MKSFVNHPFVISDIILVCHVPSGSGEDVHKNRKSHGLAYMLENSKIYCFDNTLSLYAKKNSIIYLPKNSSYTVTSEKSGGCYAINFETSSDFSSQPFVFDVKNTAEIISSFVQAERCWTSKNFGYRQKCMSELYNIIFMMQNEYFSVDMGKRKARIIAPAMEYIQSNYSRKPISISDISEMCGITPEYFRSIFRQCYGTSPIKYINNLKITRAAELISSGMCTISDAAEMSGFSDISHFSREFKKIYSVPPSIFLKRS